MNRNEQAYNGYLAVRQATGEVVRFWYEPFKLRLADSTTYTPDFLVMMADGSLECHEVKGFKRKPSGKPGYWVEEDANCKTKIAAEMFPFIFKYVFRDGKTGVWHEHDI
jgi:hypothetical protein